MGFNKYGAKREIIDGHNFASKKEANRYLDLKLLKMAGVVTDIELQPRYLLQPAFSKNGIKYGAIHYTPDFKVTYKTGEVVIEDVKGVLTRDFKIRQKLFEYKYPELTIAVI